MFAPSQSDVRKFFCETFRKSIANEILTPIEAIAADWIREHPEHHDTLHKLDEALAANYSIDEGRTNPFLHLSMHLSISEQISVDQPKGIRSIFLALANKLNSEHEAQHQIMECLGEMMWVAQRNGTPPDGAAYIEALRKRL